MTRDEQLEMERRVQSALARIVPPGSRLLLAVSGGSDSLGLLHLCAAARKELALELAVGFVNHGLRDGVDKELELVRALSQKLSIDVHNIEIPASEASEALLRGSLQAWARDARYQRLEDIANQHHMSFLATGHTRDDQAETVLLRLLRGTGLDGLAGIPRSRRLGDKTVVIRPLLDLTRQGIRNYLRSRSIDWVEDPSNADDRFLRVRVRGELLPLMNELHAGASGRIAALAGDAAAVVSFLENRCDDEKLIDKLRLSSGVKVDYERFMDFPRELWGRIIRRAIRRVRKDLRRIERAHLSPIEELIEARKSTGVLPLPGEVEVYVDRGSLFAFPSALPAAPTASAKPYPTDAGRWEVTLNALGASAEILSDDPALVDGLELRSRRPGDRLLNSKRRMKDVVVEAKVPRPYRDFIPVLAKDTAIIACPYLVSSRLVGVAVGWKMEPNCSFLDLDFE